MMAEGAYDLWVDNVSAVSVLMASSTQIQAWTCAAGEEKLLRWVRMRLSISRASATAHEIMLAVCRQMTADGNPSLYDGDWVDQAKKDGKLFFLKPMWVQAVGWGKPPILELEFHNVKLREGEELWVGMQALAADSVNDTNYTNILEERVVTVA